MGIDREHMHSQGTTTITGGLKKFHNSKEHTKHIESTDTSSTAAFKKAYLTLQWIKNPRNRNTLQSLKKYAPMQELTIMLFRNDKPTSGRVVVEYSPQDNKTKGQRLYEVENSSIKTRKSFELPSNQYKITVYQQLFGLRIPFLRSKIQIDLNNPTTLQLQATLLNWKQK
jgi:hypothetical protein